jgi:predicted nucleic acid-binding protein
LKVIDSSYLVEGLLKDEQLLENDLLITLDLAVYETANSVWKHEFLLKDIKNGAEYLSILQDLVEAEKIQLVHSSKEAMQTAYSLASKSRRTIYDTVFVALALELGSEFATFDKRQAELHDGVSH